MKCIHYCCSTANRSLLVAPTYMLPSKPGVCVNCPPKRNYQRQLSHGRRRPSKQDTKLIALSTVSSIHLVIITVKRTSSFVDRGGNYRCVSCSLDRPPAIIIADQKPELLRIADQSGNYQRQLSLGRRRRSNRIRTRAVRSTPRCILSAKKTAFYIFASTRVSESNDALIYTKAYVL